MGDPSKRVRCALCGNALYVGLSGNIKCTNGCEHVAAFTEIPIEHIKNATKAEDYLPPCPVCQDELIFVSEKSEAVCSNCGSEFYVVTVINEPLEQDKLN